MGRAFDIQPIFRCETSPLTIKGRIVGWCSNEPITCWCMPLLQRFPNALLRHISISLVSLHVYIVSFNKVYNHLLTSSKFWDVCHFSVQNSRFGPSPIEIFTPCSFKNLEEENHRESNTFLQVRSLGVSCTPTMPLL